MTKYQSLQPSLLLPLHPDARSVARRLGVAALPVCAAPGPGSSSQDSQLPPEMAAKQAGRAVLAAPSPDLWVVLCCMPSVKAAGSVAGEGQVRWPDLSVKCLTGAGAGDSFSAGVEGLVVDVTRRGATLPWTEFRQQTPAVTVMVSMHFGALLASAFACARSHFSS